MILIDFSLAVSLFIVVAVVVLLGVWVAGKKERDKDLSLQPRFIWHCSVCTYTYINTKEDHISVCPRCQSFNKKADSP